MSRRYTETINDADGFIANVWRALKFDPDAVAEWADWPVNHADLIARKARLISKDNYLLEGLCRDDKWFDAELAGYWIWAAGCWIGSGLTRPGSIPRLAGTGAGVHEKGKRPHLGDKGNGVHAKGKRPHLAHTGKGVHGKGQRPHLGDKGNGVHATKNSPIHDWFQSLSDRLRYVRVVCGDWSRVCGGDWQDSNWSNVGIFFDPPYTDCGRAENLYHQESLTVAHDVREWARARGDRNNYRIVLAGYYEEHESLLDDGWTVKKWKAGGGYSRTGTRSLDNRTREALFLSPHCVGKEKQTSIF